MAQEDDRGYLTAFLEDNLSSAGRKVTITGFEGALSSRATISQIAIADREGVWIILRDVVLDWSRSALLGGRVSINALTAGEIILDRLPVAQPGLPAPEAAGFTLPELPVSVEIGRLAATKISIGAGVAGLPMEGELEAALSLIGGEGLIRLTLNRTDDAPAGWIKLAASYGNASRRLAVDLDVQEDANGIAANLLGIPGKPAVELTIKGDDPIDDFNAAVRLASAGAERLAGTVTLQAPKDGTQRFNADLGGDLAPLFLPDYADFFGPDVRLQTAGTKAQSGRLALETLSVQTSALSLDGSLVLSADGLP
ncbi:MAG: hypothetical protein U1D35_04290 [Paracoccaceae bacterium]|nr:hypothetical protein [Paracoccaceae bacterium]